MRDEKSPTLTTVPELDIKLGGSGELVPTIWLVETLRLLNEMAGEGVGIEGCADPADLMVEIARYLGVGDADDPWKAAVQRIQQQNV